MGCFVTHPDKKGTEPQFCSFFYNSKQIENDNYSPQVLMGVTS